MHQSVKERRHARSKGKTEKPDQTTIGFTLEHDIHPYVACLDHATSGSAHCRQQREPCRTGHSSTGGTHACARVKEVVSCRSAERVEPQNGTPKKDDITPLTLPPAILPVGQESKEPPAITPRRNSPRWFCGRDEPPYRVCECKPVTLR